jgi:hypothetical protein
MKRIATLLVVAACQQPTDDLPWLEGLHVTAKSTGASTPADEPPEDCAASAMRSIELVADVSPRAGRERIVASYATGIVVHDSEERTVAETNGFPCEGSGDELDVVAVGDAYGVPMLALAATTGGRRETQTFVGLYSLPALDPMFAGTVERREDERITRGSIHLFPGGLVYARPGGLPRLWRLDPVGVYVPVLPEEPHAEPIAVSAGAE